MMPEYGRGIQQMVEHCKTIADKNERMRCARTIIETMANMVEQTTDRDDFQKKLWNHLAAMSQYELDIDYPVEIERMDDEEARPEQIPYPQRRIKQRNYGTIVEQFTDHLSTMEATPQRDELTVLVANHMKRDRCRRLLACSYSDEKVAEDMARYTDGKIQLDPARHQLISDGELLSTRISTSVKKKKKK